MVLDYKQKHDLKKNTETSKYTGNLNHQLFFLSLLQKVHGQTFAMNPSGV